MRNQREAYLLENGSELGAVKRSFDWLTEQWENPDNRETVIAVPSKRNLEGMRDRLIDIIGEDAYKGLHSSDNYADLGKGLHLHTMTQRIRPSQWDGGPVLALFVDDDQLEDIEDLRGVTSVLVVPWLRADVSEWEQEQSPEVIQFDPDSS